MSIATLASDLAARIPEMAHDNPINNANVIQGLVEKEIKERNVRIAALLGRIQGYGAVCDEEKLMDFETFQMLEANLAEVCKLATIVLKELK